MKNVINWQPASPEELAARGVKPAAPAKKTVSVKASATVTKKSQE
jgi:hypothetical protein